MHPLYPSQKHHSSLPHPPNLSWFLPSLPPSSSHCIHIPHLSLCTTSSTISISNILLHSLIHLTSHNSYLRLLILPTASTLPLINPHTQIHPLYPSQNILFHPFHPPNPFWLSRSYLLFSLLPIHPHYLSEPTPLPLTSTYTQIHPLYPSLNILLHSLIHLSLRSGLPRTSDSPFFPYLSP